MSTARKILNVIGWIATVLLQALIGLFVGFVFSVTGYNTWLSALLSWWVGDTFGIFAAGVISLLLRRSVQPKKYFMRFATTAFGALIPIAILIVLSYSVGYESDLVQGRWGAILTMLAVVTGLVGFYIPSWLFKGNEA